MFVKEDGTAEVGQALAVLILPGIASQRGHLCPKCPTLMPRVGLACPAGRAQSRKVERGTQKWGARIHTHTHPFLPTCPTDRPAPRRNTYPPASSAPGPASGTGASAQSLHMRTRVHMGARGHLGGSPGVHVGAHVGAHVGIRSERGPCASGAHTPTCMHAWVPMCTHLLSVMRGSAPPSALG